MIIVHGSIPIRPERREQALDMARSMTTETRKELGCLSYNFYSGVSDPNTLMLFQEWESIEALTSHFESAHMEEFLRQLPDVIDGEIVTKRYAVDSMDEEEAVVVREEARVVH